MFAGAGLVFIVTGLICGFVRFRHMCRPFSEREEYFYPARKQVTVFYAAVAMLFPYVLAPENAGVWTYVRIWGIIYYPTGFTLLSDAISTTSEKETKSCGAFSSAYRHSF